MRGQGKNMPKKTKERTPSQAIRDLIHHYGLSGREASRRMGVDEATIRRWIAGAVPIPLAAQTAAPILLGAPPGTKVKAPKRTPSKVIK
jgi:DNA-binding transcriptional regulator YiaG